ncbi:MAG: hypothetical protein IPL61_01365 [Myxococcales bacterium]|nr:hypothetical protein [Myxococcales bacterium]
MLVRTCAVALALAGAACGDDPQLVCVTVDLTCAPLYAPTWANVYGTTVTPKCAASGCHTTAAAKGGLVLDDPATAHAALTSYVIPGDVGCSELVERIYATAEALRMPRGSQLSTAEACALARWVAAGAPGPTTTLEAP